MIQVARIHARPLDLTRPAWEAYIIEGLDNIRDLPPGSFALYIKFHDSAIDGQAGAALVGSLHSLTPEAATVSTTVVTKVVDREPATLGLPVPMVGSRIDQAVNATKPVGQPPLQRKPRATTAVPERIPGSAFPGSIAANPSRGDRGRTPGTAWCRTWRSAAAS